MASSSAAIDRLLSWLKKEECVDPCTQRVFE